MRYEGVEEKIGRTRDTISDINTRNTTNDRYSQRQLQMLMRPHLDDAVADFLEAYLTDRGPFKVL
jgi:hypothetical protein